MNYRYLNTNIWATSWQNLPSRSESSLYALSVAKDLMLVQAHNQDSDQTGRMPRLIWVFAGRKSHFAIVMLWLKYFKFNRYIHFRLR